MTTQKNKPTRRPEPAAVEPPEGVVDRLAALLLA